MLRLAQERDKLTVINDQIGAPTGADLLADITAHAIRQVFQHDQDELADTTAGIYHLVAAGETNWFDYARHVIAQARQLQPAIQIKATEILPVPTSAFPTPARRPHNSRMNTSKVQRTFGLTLPHWQVGVNRMLEEIL
jgi:dTDP-4-dehydrorhamnose reductase